MSDVANTSGPPPEESRSRAEMSQRHLQEREEHILLGEEMEARHQAERTAWVKEALAAKKAREAETS